MRSRKAVCFCLEREVVLTVVIEPEQLDGRLNWTLASPPSILAKNQKTVTVLLPLMHVRAQNYVLAM